MPISSGGGFDTNRSVAITVIAISALLITGIAPVVAADTEVYEVTSTEVQVESPATDVLAERMQHLHNAGMPSITIRNVPDDVRDELAARAAREGRSLQEHLRMQLIEVARHPTVADIIDRARARASTTSSQLPASRILEHRDAGRR